MGEASYIPNEYEKIYFTGNSGYHGSCMRNPDGFSR